MKLELPSRISHVMEGSMGCFVACVAMLLGKTYNQTYKLVHPSRARREGKHERTWSTWVVKGDYAMTHDGSISPEKAFMRLEKLGLKPRYVKIKKLSQLKKTALIWLRWEVEATLMHSVVYDAKRKLFLDPLNHHPLDDKQKRNLERQIDSVIYLDAYKPPKISKKEESRSNSALWNSIPYFTDDDYDSDLDLAS